MSAKQGFARNKNWSKSISNMSLSSSRSMILRRRNNGGGNSATSNPPPPTATSSNKGSLMSLVSGGGGGNNNVTDGLATRNQLHFQQDNSQQQQVWLPIHFLKAARIYYSILLLSSKTLQSMMNAKPC